VWFAVAGCIILASLSYLVVPVRNALKISVFDWEKWIIVTVASVISFLLIRLLKKLKWVI
jgi:hypothetical protein